MNAPRRLLRFSGVSAAGFGVQLAAVGLLVHGLGLHYAAATTAGVAAAVVHNFAWHVRWTWRDRSGDAGAARRFLRFLATNGAVSLAGNAAVAVLVVEATGADAMLANAVAVAACGVVNYWLSDRVVFPVTA
jgi:putative flippase GtrA